MTLGNGDRRGCASTARRSTVPEVQNAIGYVIDRSGQAHRAAPRPTGRPAREQPARASSSPGPRCSPGRVVDRNGPWLAERLRELGVDIAHIAVVGDRPEDIDRRAALLPRRGHGPDRHQRRPGADGRRPDRARGRATSRAASRCSTRRSRAASGAILEPLLAPLARPRPRGAARRPTASRRWCPRGATVLEPVGTAPGLSSSPPDGAAGSDGRRPARPAARAAADVARRGRTTEAFRAAVAGATEYRAGDAAAVRHPGVRDRRDAARSPRTRDGLDGAGDHHLPAPRRGRGRHALRARATRPPTTPSSPSCASATPTRCSARTARPSTTRSPSCCAERG